MCLKTRKSKPKIGLKRKLFLAWLAFELASLPFALPTAAKIIQNNMPAPLPRVASVNLPPSPGQSRILLASNGPFALISSEAIGLMQINLYVKGKINGSIHGKAANAPGDLTACALAPTVSDTIIYRSTSKTAENTGSVIDQAIVLEINYDKSQKPKFAVVNLYDDKFKKAIPTISCPV